MSPMQNIGIITLTHTDNDNFGAYMQSYALIEALRLQGTKLKAQGLIQEQVNAGLVQYREMSPYAIAKQRSRQVLTQSGAPDPKRAALQVFKNHLPRLRKFAAFGQAQMLRLPPQSDARKIKFIIGSDWVWHLYAVNGWGVLP